MRTSVHVPDELLATFDEIWEDEGMESRSRAVREAMSEYVDAHRRLERVSGDVVCAVTFDYEYEAVIEQLHEVQHEFESVIDATSHVHHGEWCLETAICSGPAEEVRTLVYRLRDFDAVRRVSISLAGPVAETTDGRAQPGSALSDDGSNGSSTQL